jgi:hypothetical protein
MCFLSYVLFGRLNQGFWEERAIFSTIDFPSLAKTRDPILQSSA